MDMAGLRQYCQQRVEQGEAAQLIDPLLDLIEQMNDRLVRLEHRVAQLQQAQYGSKRECVSSGQLQLALLQLPAADARPELVEELGPDKPPRPPQRSRVRTPRHIPASIPRITILSEPTAAQKWCGDCQCDKKYIGSEFAEVLEFKPGEFFAERTERFKYACPKCQSGVVIGPGPHRVLDQAMPGPGLLAEVVVRKFADHCPLERQSRIFCQRYGIVLAASTLGDWVGGCAQVLEPLWKELLRRVVSSGHLSLDDTPVRVLDKAHPKGIKRGHLWSLVSDEAVVYFYTPNWKGEPVQELLKNFDGVLQSDGYKGLSPLFQKTTRRPKRAGCMAHARRRFVRALEAGDARAAIALALIRKLYKLEAQAKDQGLDNAARLALRQSQSVAVMEQLHNELQYLGAQAPPKTLLGQAVGYALRQWQTLQTFLHDGAVRIDNNHVERTLRPIALGRLNWLFGGSDEGARWLAIHQTLIGTCLLLGVRDPWEYLRDILDKLARGWPSSRLAELLPAAWLAARTQQAQAASPSLA
jgi:transposase